LNLQLRLLLAIFGASVCALLFVGYIAFGGVQKISFVSMRGLLTTTADHMLDKRPDAKAAEDNWVSWLKANPHLAMGGISAVLLERNSDKMVVTTGNDWQELAPFFNGTARILRDVTAEEFIKVAGTRFVWTRTDIPDSRYAVALFFKTTGGDFLFASKYFIVPSLIAVGIVLWASIWAAVILSNLMMKARQRELLESTVNARTAELREAETRLQQANEDLERRVEERTHELQRSRDRFRKVTDSVPALISNVDADERYLFVNSAWEATMGQPADTVIGCTMKEILPPEFYAVVAPMIRGAMAGGRQPFQTQLAGADGGCLDIDATFVPDVDETGQIIGVFMLAYDVTDRKQAEAQLIQADKLVTLGTLAAGTAHELSQPLNIIRLVLESARSEAAVENDQIAIDVEDIDVIIDQVMRMARIIEQMTMFSRRDRNDHQLLLPSVSIEAVLPLVEPHYSPAGVALETDLPNSMAKVMGSRFQLEQVLLNLLTNALFAVDQKIKSDAENGTHFYGKVRLGLAESDDGASVVIRVADNGGGVSEDVLNRIFDPFFTTKEVGSGTGLGLSVSRSIINSMDGQLDARNENGGACFTITLPQVNDAGLDAADNVA